MIKSRATIMYSPENPISGPIRLNGDNVVTKSYVDINYQTGTTYTLVTEDSEKLIICDNINNITVLVPSSSSIDYLIGTVITIEQAGEGVVTILGDDEVIVNGFNGLNTAGQYACVQIIKIDTDTWLLIGGVASE